MRRIKLCRNDLTDKGQKHICRFTAAVKWDDSTTRTFSKRKEVFCMLRSPEMSCSNNFLGKKREKTSMFSSCIWKKSFHRKVASPP